MRLPQRFEAGIKNLKIYALNSNFLALPSLPSKKLSDHSPVP
jgi:hypothetical protein